MIGCADECSIEAEQQDTKSVGPIEGAELICRAAYDPMHFKKTTLKASVLRSGDLLKGCLSVWRASEKSELNPAQIADICGQYTPNNNTLGSIRGVAADQIRNIKVEGIQGRVFCVVDETETDDEGGYHPAHAHIRICDGIRSSIASTDCKEFQQIRDQLLFLFRSEDAVLQTT